MSKTLVLAGDSVIDNQAYVARNEPDTHEQIQNELGAPWNVHSVARDGAITCQIYEQLARFPMKQATHLSITVGGNDALRLVGLIQSQKVVSLDRILLELAEIRAEFASEYEQMLRSIHTHYPWVKTMVSTIYYPVFPMSKEQSKAVMLLSIFNDVIISLAEIHRLPVVDLRWISTSPSHYANSIEPSALGGARIAERIATVANFHNFKQRSVLYASPDATFNANPFAGVVN